MTKPLRKALAKGFGPTWGCKFAPDLETLDHAT
jgi:hypothetical protein